MRVPCPPLIAVQVDNYGLRTQQKKETKLDGLADNKFPGMSDSQENFFSKLDATVDSGPGHKNPSLRSSAVSNGALPE